MPYAAHRPTLSAIAESLEGKTVVDVVAPLAIGQIAGLGWRGYLFALEFLAEHLGEVSVE